VSGKALRLPDTALTRYGVAEAKVCKANFGKNFCGQLEFAVARHEYLHTPMSNVAAERFLQLASFSA
jgi:hypothetical protein